MWPAGKIGHVRLRRRRNRELAYGAWCGVADAESNPPVIWIMSVYLQRFLIRIMNTVWIVLPILTLLMFELGLTINLDDFKAFRTRPRPVIAGIVGQILFLPLIAFIICLIFEVEPVFFMGIMIIACSPGAVLPMSSRCLPKAMWHFLYPLRR